MSSWDFISPVLRVLRAPTWMRALSPDDRYLAFCPERDVKEERESSGALHCIEVATGRALLERDLPTPVGALGWVAPDILWVAGRHERRTHDAVVIAFSLPEGVEIGRVLLPETHARRFNISVARAAGMALVMARRWPPRPDDDDKPPFGYVLRTDTLEIAEKIDPPRRRDALGKAAQPWGLAELHPDGALVALCSCPVPMKVGRGKRLQEWLEPADLTVLDLATGHASRAPGAPGLGPDRLLWVPSSTILLSGRRGLFASDVAKDRVVCDRAIDIDPGGNGWRNHGPSLELHADQRRLLIVGTSPPARPGAREWGCFAVLDLRTRTVTRVEAADTEADKAIGATWLDDGDDVVVLTCKGSMVSELGVWDPERRAARPTCSILLTGRYVSAARVERSPAGSHFVVSWWSNYRGTHLALVDASAIGGG